MITHVTFVNTQNVRAGFKRKNKGEKLVREISILALPINIQDGPCADKGKILVKRVN